MTGTYEFDNNFVVWVADSVDAINDTYGGYMDDEEPVPPDGTYHCSVMYGGQLVTCKDFPPHFMMRSFSQQEAQKLLKIVEKYKWNPTAFAVLEDWGDEPQEEPDDANWDDYKD